MGMRGKKKQIYVPQEDFDVLNHLENQPNQSQYIIRLIRSDMKNHKEISRKEIEKIVEEYLRKYGSNITVDTKDEQVENSVLSVLDMLK